jgi:hypothetical protein
MPDPDREAPLPGLPVRAGSRERVPGRESRGHVDPAAVHAAGPADLDRRGVPRREPARSDCSAMGESIARQIKAAIREELSLTASVGGGGDQAGRQDRQRPAQARWPGRRRARHGGGIPRAPADLAAVGRRALDRRGAARLQRGDDRRPGRARSVGAGASVREARRVARRSGARSRRRPRGRPGTPRSR